MSDFQELVYAATRKIPLGHVVTYQDIARFIKHPKAFRAVGNTLHSYPPTITIPCHRVVNSQGRLAVNFGFKGQDGQKALLENEGVVVKNYYVDLAKYRVKLI